MSHGKTYQIVDFEKLDAREPAAAVKTFHVTGKPRQTSCDLFIAGGSMGGVAAAITAVRAGLSVCICEETSWLGGQMTSQGVSAFDENYLVETSGASRSYKDLRNRLRAHYKAMGGKEGTARFEAYLDPGNCWVSRLAFEPKVAVKVLSELLAPEIATGRLKIFLRMAVLSLRKANGSLEAAHCVDLDTGKQIEFRFRFCIDATELGALLPLAGLAYASGAESRAQTGEEHAPEHADPENVQDFTYPFIVEFCPGEKHPIEKPPQYEEFFQSGKFSLLGYAMFENRKSIKADGKELEHLPFWEYRRLIYKGNFPDTAFARDISMINWESNDLRGENIIDAPANLTAERLAHGKNLSLGFLYWMQNEMERDEGGKGYPELKLRSDLLGTTDGVSKYPYIREARRIKALRTLVENDISAVANPGARARHFNDSLGIGLYPIDIHGRQDVPGAGQASRPFQIPASALVQNELKNFLPACKNIGCTHITNGAYRLHPIEWAIGEAAAAFAVEVLASKTDIRRFLKSKRNLRKLQERILAYGSPVFWFDDVNPEDKCFQSVQFCAISSLMTVSDTDLHFRPEDPLTKGEFVDAISRLLHKPASEVSRFIPEFEKSAASPLLLAEFKEAGKHLKLECRDIALLRKDFAEWLYSVAKEHRFFGRN